MIVVYITLGFVVGLITGITYTMFQIRKEIRQTKGLSRESKDYMFLLLGMKP